MTLDPDDTSSVLDLALAAIRAHCSNSDQSAQLTVRAVSAIQNATKLEKLNQLPYTLTSVIDALHELDQISSQAEAVAFELSRLVRSQYVNSTHYLAQLDAITCRLETASSSIRTILPSL